MFLVGLTLLAGLLGRSAVGLRRYEVPPGIRWRGRPNQVFSFVEPSTNVTVVLIGCMHYSPASVGQVSDTIYQIGGTGNLASVMIEMCKERWGRVVCSDVVRGMHRRAWKQAKQLGLVMGRFRPEVKRIKVSWNPCKLQSEMSTAMKLAYDYNARFVLGDQLNSETVHKLRYSIRHTVRCLINPLRWPSLINSFCRAMYHSHLWELVGRDLLNLRTFAATPVAIIRYFVSAIKSRSIVLVAFVAAAFQYIATATAMRLEHKIKNDKQSPTFMQIARNGILTGTSVLSLLLVQSLFVILLDDRNTFLAKNILKECARSQPGDVVVAVLGLAHCPGVRQLLLACQVQGHPPCSASRRLRKGLSTCCKGTKRGSRSSRTKGLDCWGMS